MIATRFSKERATVADRFLAQLPSRIVRPDAPLPMTAPTKHGDDLPASPGIYFVWSKGRIVYVGQSANLKQRVCIYHEYIRKSDLISWLEFAGTARSRKFAECYYIGIYRPRRNRMGA